MRPDEITGLVLTYNERENIGRCLGRLASLPLVLVVDSFSDDGTVEIARSFKNVRVVQRRFDSFARQWSHGLAEVRSPWTLSIDADYILPEGFFDGLPAEDPREATAYEVSFDYYVYGRPLRGTLYPPRPILFQTRHCAYYQDGHSQRLTVAGETRRLAARVAHDDRKPLARWMRSQLAYAADNAGRTTNTAKGLRRLAIHLQRWGFVNPFLVLVYCLFVKGLVLDGWPGVFYALQRAFAELACTLVVVDKRLRRRFGQASAFEPGHGHATHEMPLRRQKK